MVPSRLGRYILPGLGSVVLHRALELGRFLFSYQDGNFGSD
jgi:hypothetical protein